MPLKCETFLLQDLTEFNKFLVFIREQMVSSYLEIGSKHGGSFWRISNTLPKGARVVSVDLPHGDRSFKESEPHLTACVEELGRRGYDSHLFLGDSTDPKVVDEVCKLGPFDLIFIDANHTEPYVWKDWNNYGPMGEIIAFHDVAHDMAFHTRTKKMSIDVKVVWDKIKKEYEHIEIKNCVNCNGIGALWRSRPKS